MIPNEIERRIELAKEIRKLVVIELAKKSMAESVRDIKAGIKEGFGEDVDVKSLVKAGVNREDFLNKTSYAKDKAEDAIEEMKIIEKYYPKNSIHDDAEQYTDGLMAKGFTK